MYHDNKQGTRQQYQYKKCEMHYKNLLDKLLAFFNLTFVAIILLSFLMIFFINSLYQSHQIAHAHQVPSYTYKHIEQYFSQAEHQLYSISKTVSKIVDQQYEKYSTQGKPLYLQKEQLTRVKKMLYQSNYGTTGEYACYGNCTSLQFYLVNLWSKIINLNSINCIYIKYYDPIAKTTNLVYTPKDKNTLTPSQIQSLFQQKLFQSKTKFLKIKNQFYLNRQFTFYTGFDPEYKIRMAINLRKSEMQYVLKNSINLYSLNAYIIYDSLGWIKLRTTSSSQEFQTNKNQEVYQISYPFTKKQSESFITFYFQLPKIYKYFSVAKFSLLLPISIFVFLFFKARIIIKYALVKIFANTQTLLSLYQYNIQQIFTGNTPKQTIILTNSTITEFYQKLSQLPTSQYEPITHKKKKKVKPQSFLFVDTLKSIVNKYNNYAKNIFIQKNKEIMNNKFFIHASVNQLSEAQNIRIKESFSKAKQLGMLKRFFKYGYLSLLLNTQQFDKMVEQDSSPLPEEFIKLTREINRIVSGTDVRRAFRLSPNIMRQTQQQLQIRIQINLLQKYLQIFKELDVHNFFAQELTLLAEIQNINEYIQNIKHVLNKHNKNIRTLGR